MVKNPNTKNTEKGMRKKSTFPNNSSIVRNESQIHFLSEISAHMWRQTGNLEVPPQNEATVTAIVGSNVTLIKVIEGDKVSKGQVLAYLSHPNLIKIANRLH